MLNDTASASPSRSGFNISHSTRSSCLPSLNSPCLSAKLESSRPTIGVSTTDADNEHDSGRDSGSDSGSGEEHGNGHGRGHVVREHHPNTPHFGWLAFPYLITFAHVLLSPYTKVEETPSIHGIHDILAYGTTLSKYEHVLYPGPVPRSFVPSLFIAALVKPFIVLGNMTGHPLTGIQIQTLIRLDLAAIFSSSLGYLTTTLHQSSPLVAKAFVLLSMTQFHIPYYAGRTLPNFLALPLVIISFSTSLRSLTSVDLPTATSLAAARCKDAFDSGSSSGAGQQHVSRQCAAGLALLTFTATVIRLELAPMAIVLALTVIYYQRLSFLSALVAGAVGGFTGLFLTFTIDGHFYSPTSHLFSWWPELSAFIFNIPQGHSLEWGTSAWWYYIIIIPKLLLLSLPLALMEVGRMMTWTTVEDNAERERRRRRRMVMMMIVGPCVGMVGVLSCIGHKEWRFIAYIVPLINILAAQMAATLWTVPYRYWRPILRLVLFGGLIANTTVTSLFTRISMLNYPGGEIGPIIKHLAQQGQRGNVWIPAAALHSGATIFTLPSMEPWINRNPTVPTVTPNTTGITIVRPESAYEQCSNPKGNTPLELWGAGFDWVVTDDWNAFEEMRHPELSVYMTLGDGDARDGDLFNHEYARRDGSVDEGRRKASGWHVVAEVDGYERVTLGTTWPWLKVIAGRRLAIMGNRDKQRFG